MIMDDFISQIEKHMIQLKKKNMNIMNEFKIQMFQARKNIEKNIIKMQYGITQSNLISNNQSLLQKPNKLNQNQASQKNLSTNYNSRTLDSRINQGSQISKFTNNLGFNQQNEDPNRSYRGIKTDISVIQQFPLKRDFQLPVNFEQNMYKDLNSLKNDQSILINTEDVKKKYQKFLSPSAGWTISADPLRQKTQNQQNQDLHPFCTQFGQYQQSSQSEQNDQILPIKKDNDLFGFEHNFIKTNTIQQLEEYEQSNESQIF